MSCFSYYRVLLANITFVVHKLCWWVKQFTTFVTLIPSSLLIFTMRACSHHKSVGQKQLTILAKTLSHWFSINFTILLNTVKDVLCYFGMPFSAGSSKMVKTNIKPFVHLWMDFEIMIADLSWSFFLLQSFNFCCCSILVCSTNIQGVCPL